MDTRGKNTTLHINTELSKPNLFEKAKIVSIPPKIVLSSTQVASSPPSEVNTYLLPSSEEKYWTHTSSESSLVGTSSAPVGRDGELSLSQGECENEKDNSPLIFKLDLDSPSSNNSALSTEMNNPTPVKPHVKAKKINNFLHITIYNRLLPTRTELMSAPYDLTVYRNKCSKV